MNYYYPSSPRNNRILYKINHYLNLYSFNNKIWAGVYDHHKTLRKSIKLLLKNTSNFLPYSICDQIVGFGVFITT